MQTLYAFKGIETNDTEAEQKLLFQSIDNMYNLYLLILSLLIEIQKKAALHLEKKQNKILATQEDKDPNKKFINNQLLSLLCQNVSLKDAFDTHNIKNWDFDDEYVEVIFKAILASDLYREYMQTRVSDFKEDKEFIVDIFKEVIAPNPRLYEYIEDQNLTWLDDLPIVNTVILKMLKKAKANSDTSYFTPKLYKDFEDKTFALDLLQKTINDREALNQQIDSKTKNWDTERIANLDYILMQMAISELLNFASIPVKVTINEYLEIAKEYSTPKSSIFINGILDNLVKEYQDHEKLNKTGRGLMWI